MGRWLQIHLAEPNNFRATLIIMNWTLQLLTIFISKFTHLYILYTYTISFKAFVLPSLFVFILFLVFLLLFFSWFLFYQISAFMWIWGNLCTLIPLCYKVDRRSRRSSHLSNPFFKRIRSKYMRSISLIVISSSIKNSELKMVCAHTCSSITMVMCRRHSQSPISTPSTASRNCMIRSLWEGNFLIALNTIDQRRSALSSDLQAIQFMIVV